MFQIHYRNNIVPAWMLLITVLAAHGCRSVQQNVSATPAKTIESMAERLSQLEDRVQIQRLLTEYGRCLDRRDFTAFSNLFAEKDGEWIGGMGQAKGRPAIRALMEDNIGSEPGGNTAGNYHLFMNETIDIDGNRALAETKWVFVIRNAEDRPEPFYLGRYEDQLIKENDRWKFFRRVVYSEIPEDTPPTDL